MFVAYQVFFDHDLLTVDAAAQRLFIVERYTTPLIARRAMISLGSVSYTLSLDGEELGGFRFRAIHEFTQCEVLFPDKLRDHSDFNDYLREYTNTLHLQIIVDYETAENAVLQERKETEAFAKQWRDPHSVQRNTEDLLARFPKRPGRKLIGPNRWLQTQFEAGRELDDIMIDEYIAELNKDPKKRADNYASRKLIRKRMMEFRKRWEKEKGLTDNAADNSTE